MVVASLLSLHSNSGIFNNCENKNIALGYHSPRLVMFVNCLFGSNLATIVPLSRGREPAVFGRSGGLSIYFKGTAQNNSVLISQSRFVNNSAVLGGGLIVEFQDSSANNSITVEQSLFENNTCRYTSNKGTGGGGMRVVHNVFIHPKDSLPGNKVTIERCNFTRNSAMHGGGLSVSSNLIKAYNQETIPQVIVSNCHFYENTAKLGAALELTAFPLFLDGAAIKLSIINGIFFKNKVQNVGKNSYKIGIGTVYLNGVPTLFNSTVNFTDNDGSAIAVVTTYVDFTNCQKAIFCGNQGKNGGAINLLGNAVIQIGQDTDMLFANNHASLYGGAIHNTYIGYENTVSYTECFIKYSDDSIPFTNWTSKLTFIKNTAGSRGQAIFSSSVLPCARASKYGLVFDVSSFFCQWHFEGENGTNCTDQIETLANQMTSKSNWETSAFPGQTIHLNIDMSDDLGHPMTLDTVVFSALEPQQILYVTNQTIIFTADEAINNTVSFELDSVTSSSNSWHISYTVNISKCPFGYKLAPDPTNGKKVCVCSLVINSSFNNLLRCESGHSYSVSIINEHWIGVLEPDGQGPLYMAHCHPGYCKASSHGNRYKLPVIDSSSELNLDTTICSHANRTGILCGQCIEEFSVSVNKLHCINCSDTSLFRFNLALYLLGNYLPNVVLFIAIIVFNIRLTAGPAVSFIFFCQIMAFEEGIKDDTTINFMTKAAVPRILDTLYKVPYNVFNLTFLILNLLDFRICFRNMNALDVIQLEAVAAIFPLMMIILIIVVVKLKDRFFTGRIAFQIVNCYRKNCKCLLTRQKRNLRLSLLHAFAAYVLLSYNTFCRSASTLLGKEGLFNESGEYYHRYVSYHAAFIFTDTRYYQLRYALPAYIMIVVFVIPPPLVLLVFPVRLFERCIVHRSSRIRKCYPADKVAILLDTFQGCYRDNMRFFAGLYLLCRLAIFLTISQSNTLLEQYTIQAVICLVMLVLVAICQPYRQRGVNVVDTLILADLTIVTLIRIYLINNQKTQAWVYWVCYILIFLPLVYMITYLVFLLIGHRRGKLAAAKCLKCFRLQYPAHQSMFDVASHSHGPPDEVEQLLIRAEEKNDYYPAEREYCQAQN